MARKRHGDVLVNLLRDRPHAVGAEIGVYRGDTTRKLLEGLPELKRLYCVDPWEAYLDLYDSLNERWHEQSTFDEAHCEFLRRVGPYAPRVWIVRAFSDEAAALVEPESLDFVFIDGNHSYEYMRQDIALWTAKVRPGGIVAGHDYRRRPDWGVIQAVSEAFAGRVNAAAHYVWWVEKEGERV